MIRSAILFSVLVIAVFGSKIPYIRNGTEAEPGQFPFLAYMLVHSNSKDYRDAAFLISDRHLLTKASSIVIDATNITVTLGAIIQESNDPEEVSYRIERDGIIFHEWATVRDYPAILVLPESVKFTPRIQPVLLPRWSETKLDYIGLNGTAVGWVNIDVGERYTKLKLAYQDGAPIGDYDECKCPFDMLCVTKPVVDPGETGAPIVLDTPDGWVAIGIFSHGSYVWTGETQVFVRINNFLDFISENTGIYIRP